MEATAVTNFNFGWALDQLRAGRKVSRDNWNGPSQHLELQMPDENSKMTLPYIYIRTVQGDLVPWLASQTDMLASDWYMAPVDVAEPSGSSRAEGGSLEPSTKTDL